MTVWVDLWGSTPDDHDSVLDSTTVEHHGPHADFETHQGDHASVEPDRSQPSTGSHTLAEPAEAAGGSRANPANDLPDATTPQPHRPAPGYKSAIHHGLEFFVQLSQELKHLRGVEIQVGGLLGSRCVGDPRQGRSGPEAVNSVIFDG